MKTRSKSTNSPNLSNKLIEILGIKYFFHLKKTQNVILTLLLLTFYLKKNLFHIYLKIVKIIVCICDIFKQIFGKIIIKLWKILSLEFLKDNAIRKSALIPKPPNFAYKKLKFFQYTNLVN